MSYMSEISQRVGQRIRILRKGKGLSQEQLSELVGLTKNYMGLLERGRRNPSLETLQQIAYVLNVPIKYLFDFPMPPEDGDK
jgi:transcriptional regulator with XRE-family HTH domain